MTSKKAFKKICKNINSYEFTEEFKNSKKQIEKDLEILEILKNLINHLEATFNIEQFNESCMVGTIIKDYFINNDITGKVKEWLEDVK